MADTDPENKLTEETDRRDDIVYRNQPNEIIDFHIQEPTVTFRSQNNIELRITVHGPKIIQLKYLVEGDPPSDFSYAVAPGFKSEPTDFKLDETENYYQLITSSLICRVTKKNMKVHFYDREENILCEEKEPFFRRHTLMEGTTELRITKKAAEATTYFGLGDKACNLGLRGESFENWNTDSYGYERGDDPLYRSIPFYTALNENGGYGIFLDNTFRTHFDFDSQDNGSCSFSAEGGCMNYYFIYGPELTSVTERYTQLTGTPELPPLWALGYHQCRWSYFPEARVRELADNFRKKQIPCDAIYLDIDYMDDYRIFTWNKDHFPDPGQLIEDLKEQGFETIVMIDPGIKVDSDYPVYRQGLENNYFCKRPDGEVLVAPVWPPRTVFPDYTHPKVRNWWGELYEDLIANKKVSGVWNDMNEPAVFEVKKKTFPDDVRHYYDGHPCSHKKAHNIYGMQMARASQQGIKKYNEDKRPFLLTRANFSGGQRYAALWTGDNIANWDHLKLANEQCQRLSISGYSFVGSDIGGFVKDPSPELFTRWLQLGVFHPLFRNHTMGYNVDGASAVKEETVELKKKISDADQEPWSFGKKFTDINRSVIELRYRLLHYLYTAFRKYVEDGTPILRPLSYYDQTDKKAVSRVDEFLFGEHILVAPVLDKNKRTVKTYFPRGRWYDFRTNEVFEGQDTYTVEAPLSDIPFFVKAGAVMPLREVMQHTQEREAELLELNIYYSNSESSSWLYEDAEEGNDYTEGNYRHSCFTLKADTQNDMLKLYADREGSFEPDYKKVKLNIIGLPFEPSEMKADGNQISFDEETDGDQSIYVGYTDPNFNRITIS